VLGGSVFLVPVLHWSSDQGAASPKAREWRRLPGACVVTVGGPQYDAAGVCASVREIPQAGAFVASGIPTEGPLADDLRARGLKPPTGTFVRLIVPDGISKVVARFPGGKVSRTRVVGNFALLLARTGPEDATSVRFAFYDARGRRVKLPR
jgi:hypothetical protein